MAGTDPLLNDMLSIRAAANRLPDISAKAAQVNEASSRKKAAMTGAEMYRLGAASLTGSPAPAMTDDGIRTMSTSELLLDPSRNGTQDVQNRASGFDNFLADRRTERDDFEIAGDVAKSVASGAANSVLGIGAAAAGLVNTKAGIWSSDKLDQMNNYIRSTQSDTLQRRQNANRAVTENYLDKNKADYANGEIGSLRRMARDAIDSVSAVVDDPTVLSDGIAQGVGSILTAGPIARGLSFAGKAAVPLSIGLTEAGGTYSQTVSEAMESMKDRTDLTQEQKESLANKAGLEAAAIQLPAAAATGTIVSKFEKAPLKVGSIRTALGNLGRETIEEGIQSGTSQVSTNLGIRDYVDRNRSLTEGVGEQVGTGALYGLGTAGAVQTPGSALRVATGAAKLTGRAAVAGYDATVGALIRRGDKAVQDAKNESPLSAPKMDAAMDTAILEIPNIQAEMNSAVESVADLSPEEKTQSYDYLDRLFSSVGFNDGEADNQMPVIGDTIRGSTDRFDALRRVSDVAADESREVGDRLAAGLYLLDSINQYQGILESVPDAINKIPDEHPALPQLRAFEDVLLNIQQHPRIREAISAAIQYDQQIREESVSDEAIATPAGQQAVDNAIKLAGVAPERVNADVNDRILLHAEQGKVQLTNQQKQDLKLSSALVRTNEAYQQANADLGLKKNAQIVAKEIQTDEQGEGTFRKSAAAHMADITRSMRVGNTDLARDQLQRFANFGQHMQNKIEAFNRNLKMGNGSSDRATAFQAYNPEKNTFFKTDMPVWLNGNSIGSVRLAQQAYLDANAVGTLVNNLATAYPELGIKPINLVPLDQSMQVRASDAVKVYKENIRGPKRTAVQDVPASSETTDLKAAQEFERASNEERVNLRPNPQTASVEASPETTPEKKTQDPQSQDRPQTEQRPVVQPNKSDRNQAADENTVDDTPADVSAAEEVVPVQAERTGIDAAYSELVGGEDNLLKRAFSLPEEATSRVTGLADPLKIVRKALSSPENFRKFAGDIAGQQNLLPAISKAYQNYIAEGVNILSAMNDRLANDKKTTKALREGKDAYTYRNGKVLNIVEDNNGKLEYNRNLQEAAVLAGLQWLVTADERTRPLDHEDVAKILKMDITEVMDEYVDVFNDGFSTEDAITNMAQTISRYWGLKPNSDAAIGLVQGIPQSMAAEILESMVGADLIEIEAFDIDGKTYNRIRATEQFTNKYLAKDNDGNRVPGINSMPSAIELAVAVDPEETRYIGTPPSKIATTQMRNRFVDNTKQQRDAIKHEQETPHYINTPVVDFYTAVGREGIERLMGEGELATKQLNRNHAKSIEGKNRGVLAGYDALMATVTDVERQTPSDKFMDETPIYYAYNMSRVSRMQMLGKHNPQANKLVREAILPTRANLDLTDQVDNEKFMLAMAQALGVKVHKQPRAASVAEVTDKLNGTHKKSVNQSLAIIKDWLANGETALNPDIITTMRGEFGGAVPAVAIHALIEYARMQEGENLNNFRTSLYVEADGVTDGPINALVHYAAGAFSPSWLKLVAKGGLYFGKPGETVNNYVSQGGEQGKDLYQTATDALKQRIAEMRSVFAREPELRDQANAMFRVMDTLIPDLSFDGENINFERGIAKNPLTVTIYGAGPRGIAAKITKAMSTELYSLLSARNQDPTLNKKLSVLQKDLTALTDNRVRKVKGNFILEENKGAKNNTTGDNFTLNADQLNNLRDNIMAMFVGPLQSAIHEITGDITPAMTAVQQATQVQSIYLKYAFENEIQKALDAKKSDPKWKPSDFLSQKELDGIYAKLRHMSPYIETGNQTFLVAKTGKVEAASREIAASLSDTLRSNAQVYGPKEAGVAGQPFLVIGPGDGQMIQNIATMKDGVQGGLGVFDGYHMKLSTMDEDAVKINQAVHQGWMLNPLGDIQKSFSEFTSNVDLGKMTLQQLRDLAAIFVPRHEVETATKPMVIADILAVNENLTELNNQVLARHQVMSEVQMTVDHMASAERSFTSEGVALPSDPAQALAVMNAMYNEKLAALNGAEKPSDNISEDLASIGVVNDDGLRTIPAEELTKTVLKMNIPADQKSLLASTLRSVSKNGIRIIFGTSAQVAKFNADNNIVVPTVDGVIHGYYSTGDNTLVLNNPSAETLTHELIHAATINKLNAYYENSASVSAEDAGAIQRIEALMNEWLDNGDFIENLREDVRQTNADARFAVEAQFAAGNMAGAVNEFMAWTLANQDLSRIAAKTQVTNPLARIAKDALKAIKAFLFGSKINAPGTDMLSNLRFNTAILLATQPTVAQRMSETVLFQSRNFGNSDRLTTIREGILDKVGRYVRKQSNPATKSIAKSRVYDAAMRADAVTDTFAANGFPMNMQERSTFRALVTTFATEAELDPNALTRVQELYSHVTKNISVDDFMKPGDPDRFYAQQKYDALMGNYLVESDKLGRSTLMPAFLALATVNEEFRDILNKMDLPKSDKINEGTLDARLSDAATEALDRMTILLSGEKLNSVSVGQAMDALVDRLSDIAQDEQDYIAQVASPIGNAVDAANNYVVEAMDKLADIAVDKIEGLQQKTTNKYADGLLQVSKALAASVSNKTSAMVAEGMMSTFNKEGVWRPVQEFMNEMVGRTENNKSVYDMIKTVRSMVQAARQQFREHLPQLIEKQFSRPLTDNERTAMFTGIGKADLASLTGTYSNAQVLEFLADPAKVKNEIATIEGRLTVDGTNGAKRLAKAKQLAEFLRTGVVGQRLLRNAHAIANLFGEGITLRDEIGDSLVSDIDHLVSLYALEGQDKGTKEALASLVKAEKDGVDYVLSYLIGQRVDEQAKLGTDRAKANYYKGNIPSLAQEGVALMVGNDQDYFSLRERGYTRVADYTGSTQERGAAKRGYYFSPLSGKAAYQQGIIQNVRTTAGGIDPVTGFTQDMTAGRITDPVLVERITKTRTTGTGEPLMPVFDGNGKIVAYERSIDPNQLARLNKSTNIAEMIGVWRGRQVEESMAQKYNEALIDSLHNIWNKEELNRKDEYVDLFDNDVLRKDPVLADAMSLLPPDTRKYIQNTFGADGFPVRRDMLNDAIGYRSASISDAWTGNTRWGPEMQNTVKKVATSVFGIDAYKRMMQAETLYKNAVTDARVTIVVKSVVVPVTNLIANIYQLSARGVPVRDIVSKIPKKTAEINGYVKGRVREIELEADLRAANNNLVATRKINAELQSIRDARKRMSIWPLIEAGEFSSVSEVGVGKEEIDLAEGKLSAYIESLTNRLPEGVKTAGKYAIVGKDTALFKGLQRTVEYGDFIAKATLYDDLTKRQGLSREIALGKVTEEFVNYDRLPGRTRGALESFGLMWFWNFKIRSVKIGLSMLRNNPIHAFLSMMAPAPPFIGAVGNPITDNILAVAADGRLDNSIGIGQGLRAHTLNPWTNLVF